MKVYGTRLKWPLLSDVWSLLSQPARGWYSWEFLVEVCCPFLRILTLFQTKKSHLPHPFSDQTSKIYTHFPTWPLGRNYVIITWIRAQNISSNAFRIRIFLFSRSYWFVIETINTFIHSRSSLENHTRFQTKMHGKSLYPFSDQKRLKIHTLWGGTYPYDLYPHPSEPEGHKYSTVKARLTDTWPQLFQRWIPLSIG